MKRGFVLSVLNLSSVHVSIKLLIMFVLASYRQIKILLDEFNGDPLSVIIDSISWVPIKCSH